MERSADIAIIGGGIVGLAHAYAALKKGYRVVLFERDAFAVGASIRNFGLLWPIGQEPGQNLKRALRSRQIWNEIAKDSGIWLKENGSLHLAYHNDEWDVLSEFYNLYKDAEYKMELFTAEQALSCSPFLKSKKLKGALYSKTEGTVYSREAIKQLPFYLEEKFGLVLRFHQAVCAIEMPLIKTSQETWSVRHAIVCSGADFETLYPNIFHQHNFSKCKLQMMRAVPEKPFDLGPSLCAGLTLRHYPAFSKCHSLKRVDERYDLDSILYKEHGIHVLVSQNSRGDLIIGDSHHYNTTVDPFESERINELILQYLSTFIDSTSWKIVERWHGVYPKSSTTGILITQPEDHVTIVNGLGGAGMTLSFGLAEEVVDNLH